MKEIALYKEGIQKLIEESPPEWLSEYGREKLKEFTLKIASNSDYVNAGTVEFLADSDENFYFLEMNTRLQVEHTVTEMRYGLDLVKEQIKISAWKLLLKIMS